jgi:hypothetical protein
MSQINGPITVTIEILGTHDTDKVAVLLAELSALVTARLGTDYMVDCDWGRN